MNLAKRRAAWLLVWMVLACAAMGPAARGGAADTAFTYQGQLKENGAPTNGLHDFRFRLFDAASGGAQVGQTLCVDNVGVVNGLFTVQLDFGQQFATTAQRHLDVQVRREIGQPCTDNFGYVLLSPRQQLTATPLASHAKESFHADAAFRLDAADGSPASAVFVDNAGNVGIGTTSPQVLLNVNGSVRWGGTTTDYAYSGEDALGMFLEQKGSSSANSKIRLQTSKAGDLSNYSQFFMDPNNGFSFMTLGTGNGNVGIGTAAPLAKLDVRGDIRLGPSGQFRATSGEENLRIVRGIVSAPGNFIAGAGFTASRTSTGHYTVTFNTPFSDTPAVTANCADTAVAAYLVTDNVNGNQFQIVVFHHTGDVLDTRFHFIAIGPR